MKRFSLYFLISFFSIHLSASFSQTAKMNIDGKPQKSSDEIVVKRDSNGRFCAAIQVISDMDGFKYQSYNGVVEVDDQPGRDMVYLSPDERVLEIFKSGYVPLKIILSEIGIQLKQKEVWQIDLKLQGRPLPVTIVVNPNSANIFLNSKDIGNGPTYKISPGKYKIKITHPGYTSIEKSITINKNDVYFQYNMHKTQSGFVLIETLPEDAEVWIDDKYCAQSTFQGELEAGLHNYSVKKELYNVEDGNFLITGDQTTRLFLELKPNFGSLFIKSYPESGAEIFIDEKKISENTPFKIEQVISGPHKITLRKKFYKPMTKDILVENSKLKTVDFNLEPMFTSLKIQTDKGAKIYLDDKIIGSGYIDEKISLGLHTIKISKENYNDKIFKIKAVSDRDEVHNLYLEQISGKISVITDPANADIFIDSMNMGKTPKIISDLIVGKHQLTIDKKGYAQVVKSIKVTENERLNINEVLINAVKVSITSDPEGARVSIDNKLYGNTPFNCSLKIGEHKFKLFRNEYDVLEKTLNVEASTGNIRLKLIPKVKYKAVLIRTYPTDAKLSINHKYFGETPYTAKFQIGQNYKIEASGKGSAVFDYREMSGSVDLLMKNNIEEVDVKLIPTFHFCYSLFFMRGNYDFSKKIFFDVEGGIADGTLYYKRFFLTLNALSSAGFEGVNGYALFLPIQIGYDLWYYKARYKSVFAPVLSIYAKYGSYSSHTTQDDEGFSKSTIGLNLWFVNSLIPLSLNISYSYYKGEEYAESINNPNETIKTTLAKGVLSVGFEAHILGFR